MLATSLLAAALLSSTIFQPTPVEELMVPPENAEKWVFLSEAGVHGEQYRWRLDNGCMAYRDSTNLRGGTGEIDQTVCYGEDGMPETITIPSRELIASFVLPVTVRVPSPARVRSAAEAIAATGVESSATS